jgi:hypothetical protein
MDLRKETIKAEGRKPLMNAFQFVGISLRIEFQTRDEYSRLDLTNVICNLCIHSRDEKVKAILRTRPNSLTE